MKMSEFDEKINKITLVYNLSYNNIQETND